MYVLDFVYFGRLEILVWGPFWWKMITDHVEILFWWLNMTFIFKTHVSSSIDTYLDKKILRVVRITKVMLTLPLHSHLTLE